MSDDLRDRQIAALLPLLPDDLYGSAAGGVAARYVDAVRAVPDEEMELLRAVVADYESATSWNTTCTEHARLLTECRRQEERAEQAERARDGWRETIERVIDLARGMRTWCSPHGVATDYADRIAEAVIGARRLLGRGQAFQVLDALVKADPPPGRTEQAEAAIARVRALAGTYRLNAETAEAGGSVRSRNWFELVAGELEDALDPPESPTVAAEEETDDRH